MERVKQNEIEKQREWVLNYFIDPANPKMGYEKFADLLIRTAIGNRESREHENIVKQMSKLIGEIKDARQFNDTYIGHMLSEASIPAMVAHMIAIRLGGNTVAPEVSKMETKLEPEAIRFLFDLVGYNEKKASGTFTSGGSMAAFTALAVARKKVQETFENKNTLKSALFPNSDKSPKKLYVFTTPMVHYCFDKALDYLGGQNRGITKVLVETHDLKMSPEDLEKKILAFRHRGEIMAIYAIAGETETGLVDPLGPIAEIAKRYGIFTIADAAYGAPYRMSHSEKLFEDLPKFDAIIIDGHKALYTPYPNGAVLFKDARDHALFGLGVKASYVQMTESKDKKDEAKKFRQTLLYKVKQKEEEIEENAAINYQLGKKRPEGSGSAGSILSTVATARTLKKEGLTEVYNITLDRINYLNTKLESSQWFRPFHKPDVNVLCFTLNDKAEKALHFSEDYNKRNKQREKVLEFVRKELNKGEGGNLIEGKKGFFFSSTNLNLDEIDVNETLKNKEETRMKHYVLRAVLMNPRTTNKILDQTIWQMEKVIQELIENPKKK